MLANGMQISPQVIIIWVACFFCAMRSITSSQHCFLLIAWHLISCLTMCPLTIYSDSILFDKVHYISLASSKYAFSWIGITFILTFFKWWNRREFHSKIWLCSTRILKWCKGTYPWSLKTQGSSKFLKLLLIIVS